MDAHERVMGAWPWLVVAEQPVELRNLTSSPYSNPNRLLFASVSQLFRKIKTRSQNQDIMRASLTAVHLKNIDKMTWYYYCLRGMELWNIKFGKVWKVGGMLYP